MIIISGALHYKGKAILPLMKDNDELGLAPVFGEIKGSKAVEEFWWSSTGPWTAVGRITLSSPNTLTLKLNIWTVPLSLDAANHWTLGDRAILLISALSTPLLTYTIEKSIIEHEKRETDKDQTESYWKEVPLPKLSWTTQECWGVKASCQKNVKTATHAKTLLL